METWQLLLGVAGVLVVFTAVAEVTNTSLSSPDGVLTLVGVLFFGALFFLMTRWGYRLGRKLEEDGGDEE
jgi:hypothetical protein